MFFLYNKQLHNVALAIDLMRDSGMKFYAKPEGKAIISNSNATLAYIHVPESQFARTVSSVYKPSGPSGQSLSRFL